MKTTAIDFSHPKTQCLYGLEEDDRLLVDVNQIADYLEEYAKILGYDMLTCDKAPVSFCSGSAAGVQFLASRFARYLRSARLSVDDPNTIELKKTE